MGSYNTLRRYVNITKITLLGNFLRETPQDMLREQVTRKLFENKLRGHLTKTCYESILQGNIMRIICFEEQFIRTGYENRLQEKVKRTR